jgi:hypothetical protein
MTVLTMPAPPDQDNYLPPLPWRRMAWVTWRQQRATLISVPAVVGTIALFLLFAGLKFHHDYAVLVACHSACGPLNQQFNNNDWTVGNAVDIFLNIAPAVLGAFAGAPLLARELETGTYRYAWTQGFGRVRWTIAKLTLIAVVLVATTAALGQVQAWFYQPFLKQENMSVLSTTVFNTRPIAFAAWTLVAFAIGAVAGMLIRRIIPALAAALAVYTGLAILSWVLVQTNNMPLDRFWPLQLIEGGCLFVLSALLISATVWLVRRRAA